MLSKVKVGKLLGFWQKETRYGFTQKETLLKGRILLGVTNVGTPLYWCSTAVLSLVKNCTMQQWFPVLVSITHVKINYFTTLPVNTKNMLTRMIEWHWLIYCCTMFQQKLNKLTILGLISITQSPWNILKNRKFSVRNSFFAKYVNIRYFLEQSMEFTQIALFYSMHQCLDCVIIWLFFYFVLPLHLYLLSKYALNGVCCCPFCLFFLFFPFF